MKACPEPNPGEVELTERPQLRLFLLIDDLHMNDERPLVMAEAGEWAVVAMLSRQLDALRREREGGGLSVIEGGGRDRIGGAMSAESDASVDAVITDPPSSSGGFTRSDRWLRTTRP
jgi:hypothetical protein